jgi:ABC-type lipoprotein export system ATPase subunit/GNAT superfamily N-acetyltransferase
MKNREIFQINKIKRRYDHKTGKFIINITYQTAAPKPTKRTIAIAEAFGLGLEKGKFTIYDNVELKISPKDIVYITGESGSGKSVLLKALEKDIRKDTKLSCINMAEIKPEPEKPIIETVGKTLQEALELLSRVGLNDAFLFLRTYEQLSDGQKYRYKIAKMVESQAQFWILDEFAATLDRDTAKIVAYNLQKLARQQGKAVLAATTHTDLFQDLSPTVHIHKRFGKEITVNYHPNKATSECSITKEMVVEEGNCSHYKALSQFHYRSSRCPPPRKMFILKRSEELCGVIVYSYPPPYCFGRSKVWQGNFKKLQNEVSTISRVVVHPKYRTIGLGAKIVHETLARAGTPFVETLAVMAKYNPFFEKAGMQKIAESKPAKGVLWALERLRLLGFNPAMLGNAAQNLGCIKHVGKAKIVEVLGQLSRRESSTRKRLMASGKAYPTHKEFMEKIGVMDENGLAKVLKTLAFLAQTKVYLFWRNPKYGK